MKQRDFPLKVVMGVHEPEAVLGAYYRVPVSATQGWMITALLFVAILATAAWLCFRRRPRLTH